MYSSIYKQTNELLKKDENLAKTYFYNALTDKSVCEKLREQEIYELFSEIHFNEDNTEFKMSILLNENFQDMINTYVEKKIFIKILTDHDHSLYLYNSTFLGLLEKYSNRSGFFDDAVVDALLKRHRYIDEDALYYVLKSDSLGELGDEMFKSLINTYEFYEETMVSRALDILKSRTFIKRLTHRELKTFIERVSLNLGYKESKKFIMEVLSLPPIKEKYISRGKLYDFRYNSAHGVESVNSLLMSKDYYSGIIKCSDSKKAYELIEFFSKEDPCFLEYFLVESINDVSLKLDKDLLYSLIKSDRQHTLIYITNSKYGNLFVQCANYLNQKYPNFAIDKLFKILSSPDLFPQALVEEIDEYNVSNVVNYLLYGLNLPIKSIYDYEYALMGYLSKAYKKKSNMSSFKDALCRNRYGMGFGKIHSLYKIYREFVFNGDNETLKREFSEFRDIINGKNKEILYSKYMSNIFDFDKANMYELEIKEEYTRALKKCIISSEDLIPNNMIIYNGEAIPVVELEDDFTLLISAVGFVHSLKVINDNYRDSLVFNDNHELHALSTSLYSDNNMTRASGMFVLGYSDFFDYQILHSSPTDIYSDGEQYRVYNQIPSSYVNPRHMSDYTRGLYNELVIERTVIDKGNGLHISNIYPSYVLLDDNSETAKYHAVKASKELGIPIVYVNVKKIRERKAIEYANALEKFDGSDIDEYINLVKMTFREHHLSKYIEGAKFLERPKPIFPSLTIIRELTDKLLQYGHDINDLLSIEELLIKEINKGGKYDYIDVFKSIVEIRKHIGLVGGFKDIDVNGEVSQTIDKELLDMVEMGYITQRFNGERIKDARAYANACAYLYLALAEKFDWYRQEVNEVIKIALCISSNISEYKYDYYLNVGDENENYDNYYKLYSSLKQKIIPISRKYTAYVYRYTPTSSGIAIKNHSGYDLILRLANLFIEGQDLDLIADYIGVDEKQLNIIRSEIISIYNNEIKIVENKKK